MKKRNPRYINLSLLVAFSVLIVSSTAFANTSLTNKESKNKFDALLISYLQNESKKLSQTPPAKVLTVQTLGEDKIPVIIKLYNRDNMEEVYSTLTQNGADIKFSFDLIDAIAADVPSGLFNSLASNRYIKNIYLDRKIQIPVQNLTSEKKIYEVNRKRKEYNEEQSNREITPKLYESTKLIDASFMWDLGIDGSGVKIAILDTGIDDTHPDLVGKVIAKRDFTLFDGELKTQDGYGHGTHCAGIATGTGAASVIQIDTSSTDTSGLSNLPFSPNTYHVGKEAFQFWWDSESSEYNVIIVDSPPSEGNITLLSEYPDTYFDFETLSSSGSRNYDIVFDNYSMRIYTYGAGIIDMGKTLIESVTCSENVSDYYYREYAYLNHTYCVLTDKDNYVKIYVTDIQSDHLNLLYQFQSTPPAIVFIDIDGNFNTKSDQLVASNNTHFKKMQKTCYSWGHNCYYSYSDELLFDMPNNLNSIRIGFDINWDSQPDYLKGVAPGAELLNGKVLSDYGGGYDSGIIAGIEWAVLSGADVISLSLGGWENICDGNDPLSEAVEKASDMGATVVVAAGNSGYWGKETVSSPGCADKIITVGASSKYGYDLYIADFSSQGPTADGRIKPEVLAPGIYIIAPQATGTQMGYSAIPKYVSASGTSMATPHVAGAVALLKQMDSSLTPQKIKEILMNTATNLVGEGVFRQGAGIINLSKAYDAVSNSKNLASPSMLNLILKNTETKIVQLNTTLENPKLSAVKDEWNSITADEFAGQVNEIDGFFYNFTIEGGTVLFEAYINWTDSSNDIDMELYNPSGIYYGGSYSGSNNYESILIENPQVGIWSLKVYPFYVTEAVNVDGYLRLEYPMPWNWFSYDAVTNELTVDSNEQESGLYTGKLMMTSSDNDDSTMIPAAIIVSKPIDFGGMMTHSYISNPCNVSDGDGSGGGWNSPGSSTESYASFDGYFCNDLERKAYSFSIPNNAPYFDILIDWWTPTGSTDGDIRFFIYDPNDNLYDSIDQYGRFESAFVYNPMPGDWTVVVESEYVMVEGIMFSGDVTIPSIIFDPDYIWLTLEQGEEITQIINVTNTLNFDLDFSVEKAIWQETPITIAPNSAMDNNSLGPFIYSYRYYNFYMSPENIGGNKYLKSVISLDERSLVYRIGAYIFDGDGSFVDFVYNLYDSDLLAYHSIPPSATPGNWTIIIFVDGFYSKEYPFNLNLWLLDNTKWDWAQVIEPPSFFQGTESMSLDINVPQNISIGQKMAALYLSGGWWEGDPGYRTLHRTISAPYPVRVTVVNGTPADNCTPGNNLEDVNPTNEYVDFYSLNTLFDGDPVPVCAKIIARDPDGVLCGSYTVGTEGGYGLIHVYRDDIMTPSVDEGASPGDKITFYVNDNLATIISGDPTWTANGDQIQLDLSAVLTETVNIELSQGWNLISIPLILANTTIEEVLSSLGDPSHVGSPSTWDGNYSRVLGYDQGGKTFNPNLPSSFSDLRDIDEKRGYWIYMTQADTLTVTGNPVVGKIINLNFGWNLISYLSSINQTTEDALSSLGDPSHVGSPSTWDGNYSRVLGYDQGGKTFNPNLPTSFSDLKIMESYYGYWIYVIQADTLVYS